MKKSMKKKPVSMRTLKRKLHATVNQVEVFTAKLRQAQDALAVERKKAEFIWICKDGRRVRPDQMDEQHLRNSISFVQRRLVAQFGSVSYLSTLKYHLRALLEFLQEADARGLRV